MQLGEKNPEKCFNPLPWCPLVEQPGAKFTLLSVLATALPISHPDQLSFSHTQNLTSGYGSTKFSIYIYTHTQTHIQICKILSNI